MSLIVDADVDKKLKAFSPFEVVSSLDDFEGEKGSRLYREQIHTTLAIASSCRDD